MKKAVLAAFAAVLVLSSFTMPGKLYQTVQVNQKGGTVPFHESFTFDFTGVQFYNECTGEMMTLDGYVRYDVHGVYNGNKSTFALHVNVPGIKAVGESGRVYVISGTNNYKFSSSFSNGTLTAKQVQNERWITAGKGNNFTISYTLSVTVDQYGNVDLKRDEFEVHCQ